MANKYNIIPRLLADLGFLLGFPKYKIRTFFFAELQKQHSKREKRTKKTKKENKNKNKKQTKKHGHVCGYRNYQCLVLI